MFTKISNLFTPKNLLALFAAIGTVAYLASAIVIPAIASSSPSHNQDEHHISNEELARNCSSFTVAEEEIHDVSLDPQKKIAHISWQREGQNKVTALPYQPNQNFEGCTSEAKAILTSAQESYQDSISDLCISFGKIVNGEEPLPTKGGRTMNMEGAISFVRNHCE